MSKRGYNLKLSACHRVSIIAAIVAFLLTLGYSNHQIAADESDGQPVNFEKSIEPLLSKYCYSCHGAKNQEGEVSLEAFKSAAAIRQDRATWDKAIEMLVSGAMPPEDEPRPSVEQRQLIQRWIKSALNDGGRDSRPGRVTIRRLNRAEYDNTIRDLLGVDLNLAADFPSDDVGEGFDNIADVLSLPPLLLEKYVDAAEKAATAAIVDLRGRAKTRHLEGKELRGIGSARLGGYGAFALSSSGMVNGAFDLPRDGKYVFRIEAGAQQAGSELAKMELNVDGKRIGVIDVDAPHDKMKVYEMEVTAKKGVRRFSAAFINDFYDPDNRDPKQRDRNLYMRWFEVNGPTDVRSEDLPETHRRIVTATPADGKSVQQAAGEVLRPLATRAFRRPISNEELQELVAFVELATQHGDSYERGLQAAVTAMLVSPKFLFRIEEDPPADAKDNIRELNSYEVATRLSYFLWSTMPDAELFRLANENQLVRHEQLRQQVRRMIQDPKSQALIDNFAAQWLNLRNLDDATRDPDLFAAFDDRLKADMQRETELFFAHVMREDRSIADFLNGTYTFINGRLARHYGIDGVTGDAFVRVDLDDGRRAGIATQASILTLTAYPTRTSPVQRGKWVMENILGTPPPEAPAGVPPLEDTQKDSPGLSLRQQLELHRKDPICASCHRHMDALGFGLENFDAIGRWRDRDGEFPIMADGEMPDGQSFNGPRELTNVLAKRKDQFTEAFSRKMLTYALGRGLEYYDDRAVDKIIKEVEAADYRFSAVISAIVTSDPFLKRNGQGE